MEQIWACEPNFIVDYLNRKSSASLERQVFTDLESLLKAEDNILNIEGDTAQITINGVLSQNGPSIIDFILGEQGTAYNALLDAIDEVAGLPEVKRVELLIDSPGGEAGGVDEVFQRLIELRAAKEIVAINKGLIASAAYWIASAADTIVASSPTNETGSIGVVITAVDFSEAEEREGIKVVQIVSRNAPNKVPDLKTDAGLDILRKRADALERIFIGRVAQGRGVTSDFVAKNFGQGAVLVASDPSKELDAINVKLLDGLITPKSKAAESDTKVELAFTAMTPVDSDGKALNEINLASNQSKSSFRFIDVDNPDSDQLPSGQLSGKESLIVQGSTENCYKKFQVTEANSMNLKELLESSTGAKAEYDAALMASYNEGQEVGSSEVTDRIEKASAYIGGAYPTPIKNLALQVIKGDAEMASLVGAVTVSDMSIEAGKSIAAQLETDAVGDVAATHGQIKVSENGIVNNETDFAAAKARMLKARG